MSASDLALFTLNATRPFAERVAARLGIGLCAHEERDFEDGEHKARPLESVRGRHCYVVHSLYGGPDQSANDKLCRLLFFVGALKDASAASVSAVVPYLCYARKDRKTQSRDPVTTRYVACLFEAVGVDRVVTLDVHNLAAFQNSYRCRTDHLTALPLFVERFAPVIGDAPVVAVSPDIGGAKRARAFGEALERAIEREVPSAFVEKHRSGGVVTGGAFAGDVQDRIAIIVDDLISSGGTILRAAHACRELGAREVHAVASHGLFVDNATEVVADDALEQVVVTDSVPPFRLDPATVGDKLVVLDSAPLFAEAIRRIDEGGSLTALVEA
jgi:ribose-phosphate pyrophosphokinase